MPGGPTTVGVDSNYCELPVQPGVQQSVEDCDCDFHLAMALGRGRDPKGGLFFASVHDPLKNTLKLSANHRPIERASLC